MSDTVGVVIPCFNEGRRLRPEAFLRFAIDNPEVRLLFVDDASTDDTFALLTELAGQAPGTITVLRLPTNLGKGNAVRAGVTHVLRTTEHALLGYFDADLATPLSELRALKTAMSGRPDTLMAFGARVKLLGRRIERRMARHYAGRVFATASSVTLRLPVYDTQCGAKLLTRKGAEIAFAAPFISRWLFDVEIFARLSRAVGLRAANQRLIEVPLETWVDDGDSRLRLIDMLRVPVELGRIAWEYSPTRS